MSEKPFWVGKTCKELDGLHVKITWNNGDTMTSTLNIFGNAGQCELSPARHPAATFAPYADIKSIELLDDPEYERIDDIEDVCEGDILVSESGNRYSIWGIDVRHGYHVFNVSIEGEVVEWISSASFSYALRPKPKLPDHDGLWLDKNGKTWVVSESGTTLFDPESLIWRIPKISGVAFGTKSDTAIDLAPFRPAKAVEDA